MKKSRSQLFLGIFFVWLHASVFAAENIYQEPELFIAEAFAGQPPEAEMLWLNEEKLKADIRKILGHDYARFRIRYHHQNQRTVWILDEIGKEKAITCGFVVEQNAIKQLKVLIFRESRGWEIRHEFFTEQFKDIQLNKDLKINQNIDNISGATLSVRAVKKLAALALFLHQTVISK
jgi:hypothetical protein